MKSMTVDWFWSVLEGLPTETAELTMEELEKRLNKLSPDELIAFDRHFDEQFFRAYDCGLWNAAYIIGGGCSEDGFTDFRRGLICRGRTVFEAALKDPETLADVIPKGEHLQYELLGYVAQEVYEQKTGTYMPDSKPALKHPASRPGRIGILTTKSSAQSTCPDCGQNSGGDMSAAQRRGCGLTFSSGRSPGRNRKF